MKGVVRGDQVPNRCGVEEEEQDGPVDDMREHDARWVSSSRWDLPFWVSAVTNSTKVLEAHGKNMDEG